MATTPGEERIDYIFACDSLPRTPGVHLAHVTPLKVEVLKQSPGFELSDHWFVAADLIVL